MPSIMPLRSEVLPPFPHTSAELLLSHGLEAGPGATPRSKSHDGYAFGRPFV
jgi:hypothetical protein